MYRDKARSEDGYTLFCSVKGATAWLLDPDGAFVHRWHHPEGIQHAHLLPNGRLFIQTAPPPDAGGAEKIGGSAGAMLELDWDSKVTWEHRDAYQHHDYVRLSNGNTLYLRWERIPDDVWPKVRGGDRRPNDPPGMWGDAIREIDPAGVTVREWRSWEHLDFETDMICPLDDPREWTHANSLAVLPDGRWLLSMRLTSTVGIVNPETGAFDWKWGPRVLSHQHAATPLPNGRILIFDNGCHRRRLPTFSQVIEVDPATGEIGWRYYSRIVVAFYSFMVSGANRLRGGNTLITEGATGRVFEVTPEGEVVWEYVSPFLPIDPRFGPTPAIFRAHRYAPDDPCLSGPVFDPVRYAHLTARAARDGSFPESFEG
jgi:outer membrane protein assembly factor BamB